MAIGREKLERMFKISNLKWKTSITKVEPNKIITRGYPQEDLIGNISFPEMVFILLKGELPEKNEAKMLESVLVSFCDHGVTPPSTQTARIMASAGSQLPACIAGGLLAFGKNHAGAIERTMKLLQEGIGRSKDRIEDIAQEIVNEITEKEEKIPGFGHRYHNADPRAPRLIELAKENNCLGIHTQLAIAIDKILFNLKGIRMNIDGANAGILSDLGFDWRNGTGIFMIGRLPAIISHVYEEKTREEPFRKFFDIDEIYYDGNESKRILD
ncbi:MAG: citryl-CoA lyase [Methanobacteriaceae archaeon]